MVKNNLSSQSRSKKSRHKHRSQAVFYKKNKKKRLSGTEALALSTPGLIADWRQLHRRVALKAGDTHTGISHSSLS